MNRLYLDSCIVIYLIEGDSLFHASVKQAIRRARAEKNLLCISELTRLECRVWPKRTNNTELLEQYDEFFALLSNLRLPITVSVFEQATDLRAQYQQLKTIDALHVATALQHGCGQFWTNDLRLTGIADSSLKIVMPLDTATGI